MSSPLLPPAEFQPNVIVHDEIGSTNAEAMRLGLAGEVGPVWIRAKRQSAGRGRAGRVWVSNPGNLYASLLTTLHCPPTVVHQVSLLAGVAVFDALSAAAKSENVLTNLRLKWPNDVLWGGAKLAGILPETVLGADQRLRLVLGIGINLAGHPDLPDRPATDLREHSVDISPESMLRHLDWALQHWLEHWNEGAGFSLVRAAWLLRAGPVGEAISVHSGHDRRAGHFRGLDHDGALLLETGDGRVERVTFGDVTLLAEAKDKGQE
jgi:BirA family transcriptional regulator, biotin operon repressor / biotin---[acetyl-CoA-carboxylase] ligase